MPGSPVVFCFKKPSCNQYNMKMKIMEVEIWVTIFLYKEVFFCFFFFHFDDELKECQYRDMTPRTNNNYK